MQFINQKIAAFVEIDVEERTNIICYFERRTVRKNEFLLKEGEVCDFWGFIEVGLARSYTFTDTGEEFTNGFFSKHDFICQFLSFQERIASAVNVQALEDTVLFFLSYRRLQEVFEKFPAFDKFARKLYEERLVLIKSHMVLRIKLNATNRYLHILKNHPQLLQRIPLKYLASYLNITDSTLSRVRRKVANR